MRASTPSGWVKLAHWPKEAGTQTPCLYRRSPGRNGGHSQTSCRYSSQLIGRTVVCESQHERVFFQKTEVSDLASSFTEQPIGIPYTFSRFAAEGLPRRPKLHQP